MKKTKLLLGMLFSITVAACGGGGGASGGGGVSGTAAQYLTKNAVGNTWTMLRTSTDTPAGQPSSTTTSTYVTTITASTGGVVTFSDTLTTNGVASTPTTGTKQIDATGALVYPDSTSTSVILLPATFSVGTT